MAVLNCCQGAISLLHVNLDGQHTKRITPPRVQRTRQEWIPTNRPRSLGINAPFLLPSHGDLDSNGWRLVPRAAAATDAPSDATLPGAAQRQLSALFQQSQSEQLLLLKLSSDRELYLEVIKPTKPSSSGACIEALCEGEVIQLSGPNFTQATHKGHWPRLSDPWVKKCPELQAALKNMRQAQEAQGRLPSQALAQHSITQVELLCSLADFEATVAADPSFWRDGTGPSDPLPTPQDTALLSAGEIIAFLQGARGVALVQLALSFDPGALMPLLRPFVLRLLQRAAEDKGAVVLPSVVPGGGAASLVLAAKQAPFRAWAGHLARLGVQASLVADSPFYKLLVGRILGYKEENIVHHIKVSCAFNESTP